MKKYSVAIIIFILIGKSVYSQFSVGCTPTTFWAVSSNNQIDKFTISGGVATLNSTVLSNAFSVSLAVCNNLDTNVGGPTFYNTNSTQIAFFDGLGWTISNITPSFQIFNGGGCMNYLYFTADAGSGLNTIARYDGTAITTVYTLPANRKIMVADIAADFHGNAWLFSGNTGSVMADSLEVISSAGAVLHTYPLQINAMAAYGCFLMDNIIYVGLGAGNPSNPSSLIPVNVSSGQAVVGTAIVMPANNYADLASCNVTEVTSANEIDLQNDFLVYPNPSSDFIKVYSQSMKAGDNIKVFGADGSLVLINEIKMGQEESIDIRSLSDGIYMVCLERGDKILKRVFVKEN